MTSFADEVLSTWLELEGLPDDLRSQMVERSAKLEHLKRLTGENAFQRDGVRLDAKQRASYRALGIPIEDGDEMPIYNILGDNARINTGEGDDVIAQPVPTPNPDPDPDPTPTPKPTPDPHPPIHPPSKLPPWAAILLGAMIPVMIVMGIMIGYLLNKSEDSGGLIGTERATIELGVSDE